MSKKITAVQHLHLGHLHVEFEDGSYKVFPRGEHEKLDLKVGSMYPPEVPDASSEQSAASSDGDSGAPPVETAEAQPGTAENEQESASRLRGDEGEEAAAKETLGNA